MSTLISRKLSFFKDCFEADSQSKILWNIYSSKVVQQKQLGLHQFNSDSELKLEKKYANSLAKVLDRFSREKSLLLCHSFLSTTHSTNSFGRAKRKQKICCPVLYYPASLVEGRIVIDRTKGVINPALEQLFKLHGGNDVSTLERLLEHSQNLLNSPVSDTSVLRNTESEYAVPNQLIENVDRFNEALLKAFSKYSSSDGSATVYPISEPSTVSSRSVFKNLEQGQNIISSDLMLCVVPRPEGARGVLHELDLLSRKKAYSEPLKAILQEQYSSLDSSAIAKLRSNDTPPMPMLLSAPQQQALQSSQQHILSVLIGPPGTGKSYTIASLALNEYLRGNSVLVVSQNQHAVDVVRQKLIADFGLDQRLTVLTSEKGISREVVKQTRELLSLKTKFDSDQLESIKKKLKHALRQQDKLERRFAEARASHLGEELPELDVSLYQRLVDFFRDSLGVSEDTIDDSPRLLNEWFSLTEEWTDEVHLLVAKYINLSYLKLSIECATDRHIRHSLTAFTKALSAHTEKVQKEHYERLSYSHVLKAMPLWFASLGNLNRSLPLKKDLFDVVIFDEATQCNLASSLPALARAKRVVVTGDPKQLKHMSFVSYAEQQALFEKYELQSSQLSHNFRGHSLVEYALNAVTEPNQVSNLDEHFRSEPQIIAFSNEHFYGRSLKVMTQRPKASNDVVRLVACSGKYRYKVNKEEAATVLKHLRELIDAQSDMPSQEAHSFGVLSFFSHQANYLEKQVFEEFTLAELRKHDVRCGTPFSFQGEERDHMLISCAIDAKTKSSSYTYLNRDDVFNVAITRARDSQTLFLSCQPEEVNSSSKLRAYIRFYEDRTSVRHRNQPRATQDDFQNQICLWLHQTGVDTYKNFSVAGTSIDIMAVYQDKSIAIDLIGFEGELKGALSLQHYQLLSRAGLPSFLLPYQEWLDARDEVCTNLLDSLGVSLDVSELSESEFVIDKSEASFQEYFGLSVSSIYARLGAVDEPRAQNQLELLISKHSQFGKLLNQCFITGEITHSRYLNAFESLLGIALQNLSRAATGLEVVAGQLSLQKHHAVGGQDSTLFVEREQLIYDQRAKIHTHLQNNESALLQMDKTILKLSALKPASDKADIDLAMAQTILDEMTDKLDLYH